MAEKWRPHHAQKIEALYAWIATEADGGQGVVAAMLPGMPGVTPLIGADLARVHSYRSLAIAAAASTGYRVELARFTEKAVIDELPGVAEEG